MSKKKGLCAKMLGPKIIHFLEEYFPYFVYRTFCGGKNPAVTAPKYVSSKESFMKNECKFIVKKPWARIDASTVVVKRVKLTEPESKSYIGSQYSSLTFL